ncbi:MAG TPA: AmmeMemoRadiSam system protein B, partial [Vicinamibacteria bacterium]
MAGGEIRRSPIAGTWYPADPSELARTVSRLLAEAPARDVRGRLVGLISPHAGLKYSGPVAAAAYRLLEGEAFETVVLLGPSHRVAFDGLAVYPAGSFATPLGLAEIDSDLASSFEKSTKRARAMPEAHRDEHCLEMQLPFIQHRLPRARILPVLMGTQSSTNIEAAATALARAVGDVPYPVLLVASSDLSHYESRRKAQALDAEVLDRVERFDPRGLEALLEGERGHACGGGPMVAVMRAARELGADRSTVLAYGDSGDASGDLDAVVGYASAALCGAA